MPTSPASGHDGVVVLHAGRDCAGIAPTDIPAFAARHRAAGATAVYVLDVAHPDGRRADWLATPHASGWLLPSPAAAALDCDQVEAGLRAALDRGFVAADAAVLARAPAGAPLPVLSWDEALPVVRDARPPARSLGLYAIAETAERLLRMVDAGVRTVQLRIKTPAAPDAGWHAALRPQIEQAVAGCAAAGADLFVNDHWQLAHDCGAPGVHLGQEDLLAMGSQARQALLASGMALGVSSHSLWELCRAIGLAPRYIACGPVWATTTKDMPWIPQGLDNLAWWSRMARAPVVAIGGILAAEQVRQAAAAGADGVCLVRGLGADPAATVPALQAALAAGAREHAALAAEAGAGAAAVPAQPHPSLPR